MVTDEELIEGLSFPAYHRISTVIFVPAQSGSAVEMVTNEPVELQQRKNKMGSEHCGPGLIASFSSIAPSPSSTNSSAKRVALAPTNEEQGDASRAAH